MWVWYSSIHGSIKGNRSARPILTKSIGDSANDRFLAIDETVHYTAVKYQVAYDGPSNLLRTGTAQDGTGKIPQQEWRHNHVN